MSLVARCRRRTKRPKVDGGAAIEAIFKSNKSLRAVNVKQIGLLRRAITVENCVVQSDSLSCRSIMNCRRPKTLMSCLAD